MTRLFLIYHRSHRQQGRGGKEEKEKLEDGAAVRCLHPLEAAEECIERIAGEVPEGDHADDELNLLCFLFSISGGQLINHLRVGVPVRFRVVLGVEQGGDFVFRGVRLELEVEHVLHLFRADPAGDGLPRVEPGAVDAAIDRGDDGHDLLHESAVKCAHRPTDLRCVGEHEAKIFEEQREGVDPPIEGFGHRNDCTSWGKGI